MYLALKGRDLTDRGEAPGKRGNFGYYTNSPERA